MSACLILACVRPAVQMSHACCSSFSARHALQRIKATLTKSRWVP
jgi:hypothetical protein